MEETKTVHCKINSCLNTLEYALECTNLKHEHDVLNTKHNEIERRCKKVNEELEIRQTKLKLCKLKKKRSSRAIVLSIQQRVENTHSQIC